MAVTKHRWRRGGFARAWAACGVLSAATHALAPASKKVYFKGRYDEASASFVTEPLRAASLDEFSMEGEGVAEAAAPAQLFTADGAPLMTAPCCIKVVGVGGGGGNAVNRMVERGSRAARARPPPPPPRRKSPPDPRAGRTRGRSWTSGR